MLNFLVDLRQRAEYLGLRLIAAVVRAMPLDVGANVSGKLWRLIAPLNRRHQRALQNLAIAFPAKTPREREAIASAMWENLGRVMAETMQIDRIIADPDRIKLMPATERVFARYKNKMGAAVGVTLHMGNWELAIWPLTITGGNPAAVYRSVNNPYVDRYLRDQRRDLYPGGLFGRGRAAGQDETQKTARLIMDYVRQGGRLGFISDLYDANGIEVPFFGHPAKSMPIAAMIARRVGARLPPHRERQHRVFDLVEPHHRQRHGVPPPGDAGVAPVVELRGLGPHLRAGAGPRDDRRPAAPRLARELGRVGPDHGHPRSRDQGELLLHHPGE